MNKLGKSARLGNLLKGTQLKDDMTSIWIQVYVDFEVHFFSLTNFSWNFFFLIYTLFTCQDYWKISGIQISGRQIPTSYDILLYNESGLGQLGKAVIQYFAPNVHF